MRRFNNVERIYIGGQAVALEHMRHFRLADAVVHQLSDWIF